MSNVDINLRLNAEGFKAVISELGASAQEQLTRLQGTTKFISPATGPATITSVGQQFGALRGQIQAEFKGDPKLQASLERKLRLVQREFEDQLVTLTGGTRDTNQYVKSLRSAADSMARQARADGQLFTATEEQAAALRERAAQIIASRKEQAAVDALVREQTLAQGGLTRTQQLQVRSGFLFGRQNLEGLPPTLGQIAGQSVATIARFAGAGAAFYAVTRGISETVKTAQQLEYDFSILDSQMTALNQHGDLPELKKSLFEIARETGLATDQVVKLGIAFVGALGEAGAGAAATQIASKIAVVAQLDPGEIFNDLVAGMKAFAATPAPRDQLAILERIGDLSIQLRNTTGVASKEIIDFLGRVGPIARSTGLDLDSAAAAAATLLQGSAVGGAALGEQFGRILTGFSKNASEIALIAQQFPKLGISVTDALSGDPRVLLELANGFKQLTQAQQQNLIQTVGSRREGQTLAILFQNAATLQRAQAAATTAEGRVEAELAKRRETLKLQTQQLMTALQQFGLALYNAGVADALKEITEIAKALADVLNILSGLLDHIPDQFVSLAAKIGLAVGAMKAAAIFTAGKGNAAPSILEALGIRSLLGRRAAASAAVEAGSATAAAAGGTLGMEALGFGGAAGLGAAATGGSGLLAALGGPVTIGIVGSAIALPMIMKALHSRDGAIGAMTERVKQLRETDSGLALQINTDLDNLIQEAGKGSIELVPGSKLKKLRDSSLTSKDDKKKIENELKRRKKDRQSAVIAYLRDQDVIDDETMRELIGLYSGSHQPGDELLQFLLGDTSVDPRKAGFNPESAWGKFDVGKLQGLGKKKIDVGVAAKLKTALQAAGLMPDEQEQASLDFSDALDAYNAGNLSITALHKAFETEYQALSQAKPGTEPAKQLAQDAKKMNQAWDAAVKNEYEIQSSIAELTGVDPKAAINRNIDLLLNQLSQTRDPGDRVAIAHDIVKAEQDLLKEQADEADTAAEAARIMHEGLPIKREVQVELVYEQLSSTAGAFQTFIAQWLTDGFELTDVMVRQMAGWIADGVTTAEALRRIIQQQLDALALAALYGGQAMAGKLADPAQFQAILDALNALKDPNIGITDPNRVTGDKNTKDKAAQDELAKAKEDYAKALVENDPILAAEEAQRLADQHMREAAGDQAKQLTAMAERVRADRQLADAIQSLVQSQIDLVIAYANAAGNTLEAAYVAELKANQQLDYLRSTDPATGRTRGSQEQINQAQAAATAAHAATRDAAFQERLDKIEFQRQMDEITDAQEVNLLKTLLTMPELNDKQKDQIRLKIHEIEKAASSNLQFNLPTELGLPTLYEARRLDQTGGAYNSSSYVDNRQVQVNLYADAGVDTKAIAGEVVAQFEAASYHPRTGLMPRGY